MTAPHDDTRDVRDLLGMRTAAAQILVAAYVLTFLLVVFTAGPGGPGWAEILAWALMSGAAVALTRWPGDPLPWPVTVALAASGPVSTALILLHAPIPLDNQLQLWPTAAATAIYTFMCVRGRTVAAWLGMLTMLAVCVVWAARSGQGAGYGIAVSLINLAPLLMATFFAWTIRPAARRIFALRRETTLRVAAAAADTAALAERDRRLGQLDELARPLLAHIARGDALSDEERTACALLEAHLRDTLRAPALDTPDLVLPVREARARGVEVVLLDDRGMDGADEEVRARVHAQIVRSVIGAQSGTLTARILPPGRSVLATILHSDEETATRIELGRDGLPPAMASR